MKYLLLLLTIFSLKASGQNADTMFMHTIDSIAIKNKIYIDQWDADTRKKDTVFLKDDLSVSSSFSGDTDTVFINGTPYGIILGMDSMGNFKSIRLYHNDSLHITNGDMHGKTPFHGYDWNLDYQLPGYLPAFTYSKYFGYVKLTQTSKWEKCIALFMDVYCTLNMGFDHKGFRVPDQIEVGGTVLTSGQFYKYRGAGWKKGSVVGPLNPSMH